ncbi:MAG: mechanosensitive ion channel, partial [Legionella sp.]
QLTTNKVQREHLLQNMADYQNQLKKLISSRQSMAEYNLNSWPIIFKKITNIPALFYKYSKTLSLKVYDSFLWLDTLHRTIFAFLLSGLLVLSLVTQRLLKSINRDKERTSLSGFLYDGFLTVVERNVPYLFLFAILFTTFYMMNIAFVNYQLLMNLLGVWLAFRVFILIARLSLLERISDSSGSDVKLYYRLKWLLLFGGWTTAMMTFSHMLPLSLILQDIFNRLFMLFILTISLVAWRSKDVIRLLLRPMLKGKKRYLKNAILSVVVLIPITLFTTAAIGLLGFINLAWTMSTYQAYLVVVLAGFILARGLIFDLLDVFSEWMISSLDNGWLWIEVFLKPLDKILRVGLFLFSILILFQLFGWHSDSLVMVGLENLAQHTIINITGIHITVASMLEFLILVPIFVWASKWTREFCYRWLYVKAKDPGIRNSLSVFTQYSVILLGGFIALRVLGLDFSGMSMILGGLAVGMGFGLRDFASNIVGGLMLLIERPVREGDLISIGEYEGQVSHIGIRSMRVSSWDNTEVLIPNAETFNKPFTNWTHQDGIVRTQIPIKVSRSDDPVMIQQLILDVLAIMPEIVAEPPAQVFLKKIDTALIEFEARYFINVQIHNRVEIRSKVLFAITAQFKAAGVLPPVEPITVELKDGSIEFLNKKESTTN